MLDFFSLSVDDRESVILTLANDPSVNLQNFINTVSAMLGDVHKALPDVKDIGLAKNAFNTFLKDAPRRKQISIMMSFLEMVYPYSDHIIKMDLDYFMNLDVSKMGVTDQTSSRIFMFKNYWHNGMLSEKSKNALCKYVIGLLRHSIKFCEEKCVKLPTNAKKLVE